MKTKELIERLQNQHGEMLATFPYEMRGSIMSVCEEAAERLEAILTAKEAADKASGSADGYTADIALQHAITGE